MVLPAPAKVPRRERGSCGWRGSGNCRRCWRRRGLVAPRCPRRGGSAGPGRVCPAGLAGPAGPPGGGGRVGVAGRVSPSVEYVGWIHGGECTIGVPSAAIGREAVFAVRVVDSVWLTQVRWAELAAQTPDRPAGTGAARGVARGNARWAAAHRGGRRYRAGSPGPPARRRAGGRQRQAACGRSGSGWPARPVPRASAITVYNGQTCVVVRPASRGDLVEDPRESHRRLNR
jgi:hypothetical protein